MELSHRSRPRRASARCCRPTRASTRMRRWRERSAACRGACVRAAASCFGATSARPHRCEKSCLTELQLRRLDSALLHVWRKYSCMFCNNSACIDSTALLTSYTPTVVHPTHSSGTFARLRACISLLSLSFSLRARIWPRAAMKKRRGRPLELLFEILCRRRLLRGGRRHAHESRQARNNALRHTTRMQAWVVAVIC